MRVRFTHLLEIFGLIKLSLSFLKRSDIPILHLHGPLMDAIKNLINLQMINSITIWLLQMRLLDSHILFLSLSNKFQTVHWCLRVIPPIRVGQRMLPCLGDGKTTLIYQIITHSGTLFSQWSKELLWRWKLLRISFKRKTLPVLKMDGLSPVLLREVGLHGW